MSKSQDLKFISTSLICLKVFKWFIPSCDYNPQIRLHFEILKFSHYQFFNLTNLNKIQDTKRTYELLVVKNILSNFIWYNHFFILLWGNYKICSIDIFYSLQQMFYNSFSVAKVALLDVVYCFDYLFEIRS